MQDIGLEKTTLVHAFQKVELRVSKCLLIGFEVYYKGGIFTYGTIILVKKPWVVSTIIILLSGNVI